MKEKQLHFIQSFKLSKNMNLFQILIIIWLKSDDWEQRNIPQNPDDHNYEIKIINY